MVRIGIIGAGGNGSGHARRLAAMPARCRVAAVADPSEEARERLAAEVGARAFADAEAMLGEVDAVVISSPNHLHADQAVAAAKAGRHVYIEKPMALSTADADRIVRAVAEAGVASFVGFSVRFTPVQRALTARYRAGDLGELVSIWARRLCWIDPAGRARWRMGLATSGGVLSELVSHELDWVMHAAGEPDRVFARMAARVDEGPGSNDHVWLMLGYGRGTGTVEGSQMSPMPEYSRGIVGRDAACFTVDWGQRAVLQWGKDESEPCEELPETPREAHFLDVIEGRCESEADARWGRKVVALCELARESAGTGRSIPVAAGDL
jgi:predicted dehydrogenase